MVYLKAIQKGAPIGVSVSGTIDQKTYLKKLRGGFSPLSPPWIRLCIYVAPPTFSLAPQCPNFFHFRIATVTPVSHPLTRLIHISPSCWTIYRSFEITLEMGTVHWIELQIQCSIQIDCFKKTFSPIWIMFQKILSCINKHSCLVLPTQKRKHNWTWSVKYFILRIRFSKISLFRMVLKRLK